MELNVGQRLALAIDMHLILDAGAGTGKTQSIVGRTIEHYLSVDQRATRLLPPGPRPNPLAAGTLRIGCLLYTSPSPRDRSLSRMPSSA